MVKHCNCDVQESRIESRCFGLHPLVVCDMMAAQCSILMMCVEKFDCSEVHNTTQGNAARNSSDSFSVGLVTIFLSLCFQKPFIAKFFMTPHIQPLNPISSGNLQLKNLDSHLVPSGPGVGDRGPLVTGQAHPRILASRSSAVSPHTCHPIFTPNHHTHDAATLSTCYPMQDLHDVIETGESGSRLHHKRAVWIVCRVPTQLVAMGRSEKKQKTGGKAEKVKRPANVPHSCAPQVTSGHLPDWAPASSLVVSLI